MIASLPAARPMVVAHRAGNSLGRVRDAGAAGVDFIEADVWLYRRSLEVRHAKTARGLPVLWDKWSLTHSFGPRLALETLLAEVPPEQGLMLDLKGNDRALPNAVLDALARHPRTGSLLVSSQNWRHLEPFGGETSVILAVHSIGGLRRLRRVLAGQGPAMMGAIAVHERFLHREMVAALKLIAPVLFSWHVNDTERLAMLLDSGVDGIITDSIDLARDTIARRVVAEAMVSTAPL